MKSKNAYLAVIFSILPLLLSHNTYAHDGVDHWEDTYSPAEHCEFLLNKFSEMEINTVKDSILESKTAETSLDRLMLIERVSEIKDATLKLPSASEQKQEYKKAFITAVDKVEEGLLRTKINISEFKTLSEDASDLLECTFENSSSESVLKTKEGLSELSKVDIDEEDTEEKGLRINNLVYSELREKIEMVKGVKTEGDKNGNITITFDKDVVFAGLYRKKAVIQIVIDQNTDTAKILKPWWSFATDLNIWEIESKIPDTVKGNNFSDAENWKVSDFLRTKVDFINTFETEIKKAMENNKL